MTLSASRVPNTRNIKIRTTYGPVTNEVVEDYMHVRNFVEGNLATVIEECEEEFGAALNNKGESK